MDESGQTARIRVPSRRDGPRPEGDAVALERTVRLSEIASPQPEEAHQESLYSHYTVISRIGDGGMGVVYLARDVRLGRYVAIKRLNHQAQSVPSLRQRFLQEARAVAALNHIHIVHVYALGEDDDGPYIVMEYVAGPAIETPVRNVEPGPGKPLTLDQHITLNGQLSVNEAIDFIVKIGRAVTYAHGCGVIHRDLKPSNVLLDKSGEPKIVDFGLARLMRGEENKLTVPGEKLLSLGYGAPEQEQDASLCDERADVYGLGAILYYAISAQNPRYYRDQDIPAALREVLAKALATDREQRWPSAAAFTEALRQVQSKTRVEAPTVKTVWRCKWCDTVNPLTIRYCAECGWDGGEICPECGAETYVGVQYCGTCGADGRAYESLRNLIERMRIAIERHQYERVITLVGRAHGFEPSGPSGRALLKEAQELRARAEGAIARRDQIKDQIPLELRAENFERALQFIREYRILADSPHLFDQEQRDIPGLMQQRDLLRAQRAWRARDWGTAERICEEMARGVPPANPEYRELCRQLVWQRWLQRTTVVGGSAVAALLIYLLSLAPVGAMLGAPMPAAARVLLRPAYWVYRDGVAAGVLRRYASLFGIAAWEPYFAAITLQTGAPAVLTERLVDLPQEAVDLQMTFNRQLTDIETEYRRQAAAWPLEYRRELEALLERRRVAGDFEGWAVVQAEERQFESTRKIGVINPVEVPELNALKAKYKQLIAAQRFERSRRMVLESKKYINDLSNLQRNQTREGRMEVATALNAEIKRVRSRVDLQEAEAELATSSATSPALIDPVRILPATDNVAELPKIREEYDRLLAALDKDYEEKIAQWPDKYVEALKKLMEQFQREGDFNGWESANMELERFEIEHELRPVELPTFPPRLGELQKQHLALADEYRRVRARGVISLVDKLRQRLENLQKSLTRAGAMDPASVVNAEIRRLLARPEYLAAQAELDAERQAEAARNPPQPDNG